MTAANRIGAVLLGIVLVALGLFTVVEAIAITAWGRSWPLPVRQWHRDLQVTQWASGWVLLATILMFAVGLLLVIAELWRVRPRRLDAWSNEQDTWALSRDSVERRVAAAAQTVAGVESADASSTGSQHRWHLAVVANSAGDGVDPAQVERAIRDQLGRLGAPAVPVRVTVRRPRNRGRS